MRISDDLLLLAVIVEGGLFAALVLGVLGHGAWLTLRRRRLAPRLETARSAIADRGGDAAAALVTLPRGSRLTVLAELATSLGGAERERLVRAAESAGLIAAARRRAGSPRWTMRLRAARVLTLLGGNDEAMLGLMTDRRADVRAQAAEWAAAHPEPAVLERLVDMLDDPATICRFAARDALMRIGRPAVPPLAARLPVVGGRARAEALGVAAAIAEPALLPAVLPLARDSDPDTRAASVRVLGAIGGEPAVAALEEALSDGAPAVRAEAAHALGRLGHWPAAPALGALLRDADWDVRSEAGIALRAVGDPGLLVLRRHLGDGDRFAADMARLALDLAAIDDDARPVS